MPNALWAVAAARRLPHLAHRDPPRNPAFAGNRIHSVMQQGRVLSARPGAMRAHAARSARRASAVPVRAVVQAASAPVAAPAADVMGANVPRGETAGAVMVIEGVTVQVRR
jgi:hypothetical protein